MTVRLGGSASYTPETTQTLQFGNISHFSSYGREVQWIGRTTVVIAKPNVPSKAMSISLIAVSAGTAAMAFANPSAVMSMQTLSLLSSFSCLNPVLRSMCIAWWGSY